jgi:hypothetical protein
MNEWQPIESAPLDGSTVLVYGEWCGEINGRTGRFGTFPARWDDGSSDYCGDGWLQVDGTDAYAAWVKATHWMPLPEPPAQQEAK